jgi:hypothetical protein
MTFFSSFLIFISLPFFFSCGNDKNSSASSFPSPELLEQDSEGTYRTILRPLNNHLSGYIPSGTAEINISENSVLVTTLLDDDAKVVHLQSVHRGTRCPNLGDDLNGDGVIDIFEATKASGDVLIPLDRNLNSAPLGANIYPTGSGFTYKEKAALSNLELDVRERTAENLNLSGRVVLIHGVSPSTRLPETVKSTGFQTPQSSIPIVCGILKRI